MRTSMNLPDSLLAEARTLAAAEGSTVTELVIEGLRARLADRSSAPGQTVALPSRGLGRPLIDISDNIGVRERLDAFDETAARDPR